MSLYWLEKIRGFRTVTSVHRRKKVPVKMKLGLRGNRSRQEDPESITVGFMMQWLLAQGLG